MNFNSFLLNAYKNSSKTETNSKDSKKNVSSESNDGITVNIGNEKSNLTNSLKKRTPYSGNEQLEAATKALTSGGLLKVPALPRDSDGRESVYRRVAKFLLLIGVDEAAKVLPHLSDEQTEKIIPEIASIRYVEPDEAEEILKEFQSLFYKAREEGGVDTAKEILQKAFGVEKANSILDNVTSNLAPEKPFEYLSESDSDRISILLKDESNAVKALVLSYLKPKIAAEVIKNMSVEDKKDVIIRLANLKNINPDVLKAVDKAMHEKVNKLSVKNTDSIDGRSALAEILRRMKPGSEEEILEVLSEHDEELSSDLRNRLFTLDDIVSADDKYIQNNLMKMSDNDIAYLIAAKKDIFRNKILSNISQNRAKDILEIESINKPMRKSEVDKITNDFILTMRKAFDEGELIIKGRDGEIYV